MNYDKAVSKAFNGLLLNLYFDLRKTLQISTIVVISIALFDFGMVTIFLGLDEDISNDASGILVFGTVAMIIAFSVYTVMSTSKEKLREKFAFPINRTIFAISNFLFYIIGSFLLLGIISILAPFEILLYKLVEVVSDKFLFLNLITLDAYLIGFVAAWGLIIAIGSFAYAVAMYVRQYTVYAVPILGVLFASIFLFGWFGEILNLVFQETNLLLLTLKLLGFSVVCHGLGYIALRTTEVN